MAEELQGLLDRINEEGLKKAESEKERILAEAEKEAGEIIEKGKAAAERLMAEAQREIETLRGSGEAALRQAARDVIISLEAEIKKLLSSIVQAAAGKAMTPAKLAKILAILAAAYADKQGEISSIEVLAPEGQLEELRAAFQSELAEGFKAGVELRPASGLEAGIKVSFDGKAVVHDFSSEAVSDMLCAYLAPRILAIIRNPEK